MDVVTHWWRELSLMDLVRFSFLYGSFCFRAVIATLKNIMRSGIKHTKGYTWGCDDKTVIAPPQHKLYLCCRARGKILKWVVPRRMWTNSIKRTSLCLVESLSPLIYSLYREQPLLKTFQYFSRLLVSAAYQRQSCTLLGFAYFFFLPCCFDLAAALCPRVPHHPPAFITFKKK